MFWAFSLLHFFFFFLFLGFETNVIVPKLMLSLRSDIQVQAFQKDVIEFLIGDKDIFKTHLKEV